MKLKKVWKEHKKKILITGGVTILSIGTYLLFKRKIVDLSDECIIHWKPEKDKFINLEKVKEILDRNKDNTVKYAIFREGVNPDEYTIINLD